MHAVYNIDLACQQNLKWDGVCPETYQPFIAFQKRILKSNLLQKDKDLRKWFVFVRIQCASKEETVTNLLPTLFDKIMGYYNQNTFSPDDVSFLNY